MEVKKDFIKKNLHTNPKIKMKQVKAIVLHWTATPKANAYNVRNYFDNRNSGYGSAHYIINQDGIILNAIDEVFIAYHCGAYSYTEQAKKLFGTYACSKHLSPNYHSIGIELCHDTWEGDFSKETLDSCKNLVFSLCQKYSLNPKKNVLRHYDITGKICPKYFVSNEKEWIIFLDEIKNMEKTC